MESVTLRLTLLYQSLVMAGLLRLISSGKVILGSFDEMVALS